MDDRLLWGIRLMRGLSAAIEVGAVLMLFKMRDSGSMLRLNSYLGIVGPIIFIAVSALGLADAVGKVAPGKLLFIVAGIVLVVVGTRA